MLKIFEHKIKLIFGAPQGIRTPDLWFRRPTLYPAELAAHKLLERMNLKLSFHCSKKGESVNAH